MMSIFSKFFHREEPPREIVTFEYAHRGSEGDSYNYTVRAATAPAVLTYAAEEYDAYGTMRGTASSSLLNDLTNLCTACGVEQWNGFRRAGVRSESTERDGFLLRIIFNDGSEVSAEGENRYPEGYRSFRRALTSLFTAETEAMLAEARKARLDSGAAEDLEQITATFVRRGSNGGDRCVLRIARADTQEANFELTVVSDGTYLPAGEQTYRAALPDAAIPFARFAALAGQYDLFRWQPHGAADFAAEGESFRLSFRFEDGTAESKGEAVGGDYDAFRTEFLTLLAVTIRIAETQYGWLPAEEPTEA